MDRQEPPKTPQNGQPPVPPPKKDKEFNFGKNLLGILASLLVFIGILLTAWASGSRWIQLCGILAAGLFLMLLGMLASRRKSAYRTFFLSVSGCGAGAEYVAVSPDGDIFPCHQFVGEAEWKMGSVLSGEFNTGMQQDFLSCNILTKPECRACWAKYFCSGGCAANAWKYNGDIRKPYRATCEFEKKRTECALGIFAAERES